MAEHLLNEPDIESLSEQQRRRGMAQVVEGHAREPVPSKQGWKWRMTFRASRGVPMAVVKTRPESCQGGPAASRSSSWRSLWARRASMATAGSCSVRRLRAVFGSVRISFPSIR